MRKFCSVLLGASSDGTSSGEMIIFLTNKKLNLALTREVTMDKTVVLLQGGHSPEREVSIKSAQAVSIALDELGYSVVPIDPADFLGFTDLATELLRVDPVIVFNSLHGGSGEDGTIQAFLKILGIPCTGSGMRASALCMDKAMSYAVANGTGTRCPETVILTKKSNYDIEKIVSSLGLPFVVKPNDSGSSVGIGIVNDLGCFSKMCETAFNYSDKILCQKYIPGTELTVSILGDNALPVVEIAVNDGWYDYNNKYTKGNTKYLVPARISNDLSLELQQNAESLFHLFGCRAYARIDYRFDGNGYYFLEANTLPGMTELSLTPMAAAEVGISFKELIAAIIKFSL